MKPAALHGSVAKPEDAVQGPRHDRYGIGAVSP